MRVFSFLAFGQPDSYLLGMRILQFRELANYERLNHRSYDDIIDDLFSDDADKTKTAVEDILLIVGKTPSEELTNEEIVEAYDIVFNTEKIYE